MLEDVNTVTKDSIFIKIQSYGLRYRRNLKKKKIEKMPHPLRFTVF